MTGSRNAPSLLDASDRASLFWDGRRSDLETLVLDPLLGPREHGLQSVGDIERRVADGEPLRRAYSEAYGPRQRVRARSVARALAAYVSTLKTTQSPFDRYAFGKDSTALDPQQEFGYRLFAGRAGCTACHLIGKDEASFTDDRFHDQGVGTNHLQSNLRTLVDRALAIDPVNLGVVVQSDPDIAALGRFLVTRQPRDIGAFRTPSLRNVSLTAPYMHDGSISTLREAVKHELYYSAQDHGANFSYEEQEALIAFLQSLTDQEQCMRSCASY